MVWFCSSLYHHKHSKLNHFCCGLKCQVNIIILRMRTIRESSSTPCPWWMLCSSFITWPSSFWSSDSSSRASPFVSRAPQMARQGITTWASSGEEHTMCCLGSGSVGCRLHWQKFNPLSQLYTLKTQQCLTNNKWEVVQLVPPWWSNFGWGGGGGRKSLCYLQRWEISCCQSLPASFLLYSSHILLFWYYLTVEDFIIPVSIKANAQRY